MTNPNFDPYSLDNLRALDQIGEITGDTEFVPAAAYTETDLQIATRMPLATRAMRLTLEGKSPLES